MFDESNGVIFDAMTHGFQFSEFYKVCFFVAKKVVFLGPSTNNNKHLTKYFIMNIPDDLKYTKDHEWIKVEGDTATVGITDYAQHELGDIVYIEVNTVGETLEQEETFGTIEAVKTVSDLFMPVSGEVIEFNEELESNPEIVNKEPYSEGWIVKIKLSNPSEVDDLLDADSYKDIL